MKEARHAVFIAFLLIALFSLSSNALATPSTTYWTPMTPDIQPYGVLHLGIDNYFTVFRKQSGGSGSFPTDVGLTMGVLPFEKIQMEVGVDLVEPSDDPLFFNAKIGSPEGALFNGSPALQIGLFNAGTKRNSTNQNIFHVVIGKTILPLGRISFGPYIGNSKVLRDSEGNKENTGVMVAFDRGFIPVKDKSGDEYNKVVLAADYASGKNAIGGGGVGLYYYFTKNISFLTGPVWFNNQNINGRWKWTTQIDINIDLFK